VVKRDGLKVEDYATEVDQVNVADPVRAELDDLRAEHEEIKAELNELKKYILDEAAGA
jgi:uncharacterized membrane protein